MRRYFVNRTTGNLQLGRADTGSIGSPLRGASGEVSVPWGGGEVFQLGFIYTGDQTNSDMGTAEDLGAVLVLKDKNGEQPFDGPALTKCVSWTKETIEDQIYYQGTLDLSRLELAKLLGISIRSQKEKILVQCVADVDGSLDGASLKIAIDKADGETPAHYCYFDFFIAEGVDTEPEAGDFQKRVTLSLNATDADVATAFAAAVNDMTGDIGYTAVADGPNVTLTKSTVMPVAQHDALSSGFAIALLAIGGTAGAVSDEEAVELNAEFSYLFNGARQFCAVFTVRLTNTLFREGQATLPSGLIFVSSLDVQIRVPADGYSGGVGNLDGIATANGAMPTDQVVWFIHATEGIRFFQLVAGTDAESSPAIIRPDDYDGSTNARVWKQV